MSEKIRKEEVLEVLKKVIDPELGVNVVDLGLIYDIEVNDNIHVKMTFTVPTCPLGRWILGSVTVALEEKFGKKPDIELVFDPPWNPDMMSDEAKRKLGYLK
ncbi:aromatic ring hydroxylase [Candidatus Micrarchaeota archaeon]|nr:MAG: aromatic ring hydroxylase [Candidatus Micrarchaeota archaeon]